MKQRTITFTSCVYITCPDWASTIVQTCKFICNTLCFDRTALSTFLSIVLVIIAVAVIVISILLCMGEQYYSELKLDGTLYSAMMLPVYSEKARLTC